MKIKNIGIRMIFRYIWLIIALAILLYVLTQGIYTQRTLVYQPDFSQSITKDITGWYPEVRGNFEKGRFNILSEPLYLKLYMPIDFDTLTVEGSLDYTDETIRLGLRQVDGQWDWQDIQSQNFSLTYNLKNVQVKSNQVEIILSIPDLSATSSVALDNNWKFSFER